MEAEHFDVCSGGTTPDSSASGSSCWVVGRLQRTPSRTPSWPCTVIWSSLRDPEAAEAYLRSAVLNRCRSWVRRQVTQRAPRPLMLVREQQESPEDTAVGRAEAQSLVAAMRTLARRQREVLACRYVLELSVAETAQLLQISEGSVKTHTHRGLQALQRITRVTP